MAKAENRRSRENTAKAAVRAQELGKRWFNEREAAGYLGVSQHLLYKWRKQGQTSRGEVPPRCHSRGRQYYYRADELDAWIERGTMYGGAAE